MALGVQANARTQRKWFCVAVEYRLKLNEHHFQSMGAREEGFFTSRHTLFTSLHGEPEGGGGGGGSLEMPIVRVVKR